MPNRIGPIIAVLARKTERVSWKQVALLAIFAGSAIAAYALTPRELIERAASADWGSVAATTIAVLSALAGIAGGPVLRPRQSTDSLYPPATSMRPPPLSVPPPPPVVPAYDDLPTPHETPRGKLGGSASLAAMALTASVALLAAVLAMTLSGCGASQLRQHAIASRMTMATLAGSGVAIEQATRLSLARCPDADGTERSVCIDDVERKAVAAAAARDALIVPAHAYRDAVLATGGAEAPGLMEYLSVIALAVALDWPVLAASLAALGVPVPAIAFPVPAGDDR